MKDLTTDVARVRGGQPYKGSCNFNRLTRTAHGDARAELLDRFVRHGRRTFQAAAEVRHACSIQFRLGTTYMSAVQMGPGATALHLMPFSPTTWLLIARMNATMAPFVAV